MKTYPFTPSQFSNATAADIVAFLKSPTLVARRFGEILSAQQFLGLFLLQKRFTITGGAIGVPKNEVIRADRGAEIVAPGAEYKLTPMSREEYEFYQAMKEGLATEITDEEVGRLLRQPVDDAFTFLQTELVFSANDMALGAVASSVTNSVPAGSTWTNGKQVYKDALRVKARVRKQKLGYDVDTVVLPGEQYAEVIPELLDILPRDDRQALTDGFPSVGGLTWISDDGDDLPDPLFVDRRRFGGIAREQIPSPEYRAIGGDTGVEIASIREPKGDKTRLQARNVHVPIVTDPLAGFYVTGTEAPLMSQPHIVTAAVVKVSIGSPSGNSVAQFVRRGDLVPLGVDDAQLERLVRQGFIKEFEVPEPEDEPPVFTQDDVDAAVKAANDARTAELEAVRAELKTAQDALAKAPATTTAAKQPAVSKQS